MSSLISKILRNSYTRFLLLFFIGLLSLVGYYLYSTFQAKFDSYTLAESEKLKAVCRTVSEEINGDQLAHILKRYPNENGIYSNLQHPYYYYANIKLAKIKALNELNSEIFTLVYDSTSKDFCFGYSSAGQPHFRHHYKEFPEELKTIYFTGGSLKPYRSENGYWISAVHPIYDSNGKIVSIVEVDTNFEAFYEEIFSRTINDLWISAGVFIILGFLLYRMTRNFLSKEEKIKQELIISKKEIESQNLKIKDSINYAKRIQDSMLPKSKMIKKYLPESFVLYNPRDIVSGDFYWFAEQNDSFIIAAADCTGHGVPGALMSMIGNTLLTNIVKLENIEKPSDILYKLRKEVITSLETDDGKESKDGMDIALVKICHQRENLQFAGAYNPLYIIRKGELIELKGTKQPIGKHFKKENDPFDHKEITLEKGDMIYIFSDGYPDQFGGPEGRKFGTKQFKEFLINIHELSADEQQEALQKNLDEWRGSHPQLDDILVIGFRP